MFLFACSGERGFTSILDRWQSDETYWQSQLAIIGRMHGFDTWITLYIFVSETMRRNNKEKNMHILYLSCVDENRQAPPLSQRPRYREAIAKNKINKKEKRERLAHFIPVNDRKRLHNRIDPSLQGYLEWLRKRRSSAILIIQLVTRWEWSAAGILARGCTWGMRYPHDVLQTVGDAATRCTWWSVSVCLHFLRKTAFVLVITGQGFCVGQRVHCTRIPLMVLLPQHCLCCASLCQDQIAVWFAWSSGSVSFAFLFFFAVIRSHGHQLHRWSFTRTRLLFGLSGRHWVQCGLATSGWSTE